MSKRSCDGCAYKDFTLSWTIVCSYCCVVEDWTQSTGKRWEFRGWTPEGCFRPVEEWEWGTTV